MIKLLGEISTKDNVKVLVAKVPQGVYVVKVMTLFGVMCFLNGRKFGKNEFTLAVDHARDLLAGYEEADLEWSAA